MKKIFIALAILASTFAANAQVLSVADAKKAAENARIASENPKKSGKLATWMKLGEAYMAAYESARGSGWVGGAEPEVRIVLGGDKPSNVEDVTIGGALYQKQTFATRNYYYDESGILAMIDVTEPVYDDVLDRALKAYEQAGKLDPKGTKTEDIKAAIDKVNSCYMEAAMNAYMFNDMAKASNLFVKAAEAAGTAPLSVYDSTAFYNAGYTALAAGKVDEAYDCFKNCYDHNYYYEGGEVYTKLAEIASIRGDKASQVSYLEEGFKAFPQSQSILIGLINYYLAEGTNTDKLFELLAEAERNEPNNASLFYVEGNIHKQFGQIEEAIASYDKAAQVDATYPWGYYGKGVLYYEDAVNVSNKAAEEMDDAKYMALVEQFENDLIAAIEPFEKTYEVASDPELKQYVAEYLKNIYYRFQDKDEKYKAGYEKYNSVLRGE